ncbi:unnamed protein product [Bathycoccus prasinos]|jgi:hypothetical protein|tara:strand:+ start:113 stop:301 length:189 start_codon:yes stop_codon:yes gene_type:complete
MSTKQLADGAQKLVAASLGVTTVVAAGWFVASGARIVLNAGNTNDNTNGDERSGGGNDERKK